jgi:hypothetical protein
MFPQILSMFLLFCILTNLLSIYAPVYVAAGSLKPSSPKLGTVLLQLAMFTFVFPLTQGPTLIPLGVEAILSFLGRTGGVPICLLLTLAECAAVLAIYYGSLHWQGELLQAREQRILDTVASKST